MRTVGIVPAAGRAVRLQPLAGSKELLVVRGRPVMDFVVERMRRARPDEIRVVTRPDKPDVAARARELGAVVVEGEPPTLAASLALGADALADDDLVLWGFPDSIWEPEDGFVRLLAELDASGADAVLGLFEFDEPERSDVVTLDADGRVAAVDVKPAAPESRVVWGCGAARRAALAGLATVDDPGHALDALARTGHVRGVRLSSEYLDVGTPAALARAGR